MEDRTRKKIRKTYYWRTVSSQHCLLAEGDIGAPISTLVNSSVRLTYFHTNRLLNELYKQDWKYAEEKMTATLKSKQTSIATVRYHLLPVASLLIPLIFHYPLPLKKNSPRREIIYCKSAILSLSSSKILTTHPPLRPASVYEGQQTLACG
jgi:hypothetical protein